MDKHFNRYGSKAEYAADAERQALKASTISDVAGEIEVDGYNVETDYPDFGDAVFHDAEKRVHFIVADTLHKEGIPSDWVFVGACGPRLNGKIAIVHKENANKKFAEVFRWTVTGMVLDGTDHTSAVTLLGEAIGDFVYNATDIRGFATQLNTYLAGNHPIGYEYSAYVEDDKVILQMDTYTKEPGATTMSGLTITVEVCTELPVADKPMRRCGTRGNGVINEDRFINWGAAESTSTAYNPTSVLSSIPLHPVVLPAYLGTSIHRDGDMCAYLRGVYGEGQEGWENYVRDMQIVYPYANYGSSDRYGTGKDNTYKLARKTYLDKDGVRKPLHPIADYIADKGFDGVDGLAKGDWYGATMGEYRMLMEQVTLGGNGITVSNCDKLNKTLSAMGANTFSSAVKTWLFSRSYSIASWFANNTGNVDSNGFSVSNRAVAFTLYSLKK